MFADTQENRSLFKICRVYKAHHSVDRPDPALCLSRDDVYLAKLSFAISRFANGHNWSVLMEFQQHRKVEGQNLHMRESPLTIILLCLRFI